MKKFTFAYLLKLIIASAFTALVLFYAALFLQNITNWGWYELRTDGLGTDLLELEGVTLKEYGERFIPGAIVSRNGESENVYAFSADYVVRNISDYEAVPVARWSSENCHALSWWAKHVKFRDSTQCLSQRYGPNADERLDLQAVQTADERIFVHVDYRTNWGMFLMAPAIVLSGGTAILTAFTVAYMALSLIRPVFKFVGQTSI